MRTLKRRILLAQEEAGIGDQLGNPLFVEVVDQSVPDPDGSNVVPLNAVQPVQGYRAGGRFPAYLTGPDGLVTVHAKARESLHKLQRRCGSEHAQVALWWPIFNASGHRARGIKPALLGRPDE